jgi:hypothetical protein
MVLRGQLYTIGKIAAVVVFMVLSAILFKYSETGPSQPNLAVTEKNAEMNEAEQFYTRMLEISYNNIRQIKFPDESQKAKLLEELSQKDESYSKMKEDFLSDPSNEMAQQAMVNYYETRLEVLNQIVANLKQVLSNNS